LHLSTIELTDPSLQDVFSYNVEQARNDNHNMIPIVMFHRNISLQEAVDFVGGLCKSSVERFETDRTSLPSWGPQIDRDVAKYIDGLQNWIVGMVASSPRSQPWFTFL